MSTMIKDKCKAIEDFQQMYRMTQYKHLSVWSCIIYSELMFNHFCGFLAHYSFKQVKLFTIMNDVPLSYMFSDH